MNHVLKKNLARSALSNALKFRRDNGFSIYEPIPLYDIIEKLGIELRFIELSNIEGLYIRKPSPTILINTMRPQGRKLFTSAHELGHHVYKHGNAVDEVVDIYNNKSADEFLVDCFAGYLLMPPAAVSKSLSLRGWSPINLTPEDVYLLSNYFGVGYTSFLSHMYYSLRIIGTSTFDSLVKVQPIKIKEKILGKSSKGHLIVLDDYWTSSVIELEVGDKILLKADHFLEGNCLSTEKGRGFGIEINATMPGQGAIINKINESVIRIRVTRKEYQGRSIFRYLPDAEYGN